MFTPKQLKSYRKTKKNASFTKYQLLEITDTDIWGTSLYSSFWAYMRHFERNVLICYNL